MNPFEWQYIGDDQWIYGTKVRGLVRQRIAEVYFDEDCDSPLGGWQWMAGQRRGNAHSLAAAIQSAEEEIESKTENWPDTIKSFSEWSKTASPVAIVERVRQLVTNGDTNGMHWTHSDERHKSWLLMLIQEMVCAHTDAKTLASS